MMYVNTAPTQKKNRFKGNSPKNSMGVPLKEVAKNDTKGKTKRTYSNGTIASESEAKKTGISSGKVILFTIVFGVLGLLYLTHVFKTQKMLKEVQQMNREYQKVKRVYSDRKFTYDRMIGPAEVYNRAKKLGLEDGGAVDGIIYLEK